MAGRADNQIMTVRAEAVAPLPAVTVTCNRCGHRWPSQARRHVTVRCPSCGCGVRVKRPGGPQAGPAAAPALPARAPAAAAAQGPEQDDLQDDDDDGPTYIYDEHGRLVLAEWTAHGYLTPARPRVDHPGELADRGYVINGNALAGICPIVNTRGISLGPCGGAALCEYGPHRVCEKHHRALTTPLPPRGHR
jgi:hypothetical protein